VIIEVSPWAVGVLRKHQIIFRGNQLSLAERYVPLSARQGITETSGRFLGINEISGDELGGTASAC